jgi:hypothetical protein
MSDNHFDKFDEKFVDQAWAGMQDLLDKELPVSDNKDRKVLFWWPFAGIGLTLLGGLYLFHLQTSASQLPQLNTPYSTPESISYPGEIPIAKLQYQVKELTEEKKSDSSNFINDHTKNTPQIKTTATRSGQKSHTTTSVIEAEKYTSGSEVASTSEPSDKQNATLCSILEQLPGSQLTELSTPLTPLQSLSPIVPTTRSRTLKVGIEGKLTSFGTPTEINAYGAGLIGEWSKGDSRWYYLAGIGYEIIKPQESDNETVLTFNNTALLPSSTVEGDNIGSYITINSSISELRYAYLKFATGYRLTDKLSTELGFMPSLLQASTLTETWSHAIGEQTSAGDLPERTPFVSRITDNPDEVVSYNLSMLGGLSYQLNPTFALRLQYQYGLLDIFDGRRNDTYLRGVNLSVAYYIR